MAGSQSSLGPGPGARAGSPDSAPSSAGRADDMARDIDARNEVRGPKLVLIHAAICLCTFLVGLDFNLIATAIPAITAEFTSIRDVGWYGASFMLALCPSQPLAGKTYSLFSKKAAYLVYLFVFEAGSLACALAPSSRALVAGRAIAGLGASGVFAGGFTLLTTIIPLHKRAIWTGIMGSTFAVASIVGPVLSGALTQHVSWRWCFYINLPIGGAAALVFIFLVHLRPAETEELPLRAKLESLDLLGFAIFASSVTMLLLALQWGGAAYAWSSSVVVGLFVGAGLVMAHFLAWQAFRADRALIPPRLFSVNRNPALICAAAFFVNGPFQIVIYWLPIWFQAILGASPTRSGVNYLPTVIADVLAAFLGSAAVMRLGWWNPFILGAEVFVCIGGGLLSTVYPEMPGSRWIGYQIFGGIGYSLASNLSHLAMQSSLPQDLVPIGSSTLLAIISTSCAVFSAIGLAVFQKRLEINLEDVVPRTVVERILSAGATNIGSLVEPDQLFDYIPAGAPAISFILIAGCKWISTKSKKASLEGKEKTSLEGIEMGDV